MKYESSKTTKNEVRNNRIGLTIADMLLTALRLLLTFKSLASLYRRANLRAKFCLKAVLVKLSAVETVSIVIFT